MGRETSTSSKQWPNGDGKNLRTGPLPKHKAVKLIAIQRGHVGSPEIVLLSRDKTLATP